MESTVRKQIIKNAYISLTINEIAELLERYPEEIEDHLFELQKDSHYTFTITPARCRKCEFQFRPKIRKPGKCPNCKSTWIIPPRFKITPL